MEITLRAPESSLERLPGETAEEFKLALAYALDPGTTYGELARRADLSEGHVAGLSRRFRWRARRAAMQIELACVEARTAVQVRQEEMRVAREGAARATHALAICVAAWEQEVADYAARGERPPLALARAIANARPQLALAAGDATARVEVDAQAAIVDILRSL